MQVPVDITFRGMAPSPSVEVAIHRWVSRLERTFDRILYCDVVVEIPHRHQRTGSAFHIRIDVAVPDRMITVSRDPGRDEAHGDAYIAIADAFRAARRQLQNHAHIVRGEIKLHA